LISPPLLANQPIYSDWKPVELRIPKDVVLLDIGSSTKERLFLVGTQQTILQTDDAGKSWAAREIPGSSEGVNYRFNSISFFEKEGWIVGEPAILLYTSDAGDHWDRIPLSSKLPGAPMKITATGRGKAEIITNQGAIYSTSNQARSWNAEVRVPVDSTLNQTVSSGIRGASYFEGSFSSVDRAANGQYVAVSARGNFFLTWAPGDAAWQPCNRPTGRRIQNMGWSPSGKLWLTTRGGEVRFGYAQANETKFDSVKLQSRGFGILGIGFRSNHIAYACGGSGSLFKTVDGGKSWKRDKSLDELAGNLYTVKFTPSGEGFVLGSNAILLRFVGTTS